MSITHFAPLWRVAKAIAKLLAAPASVTAPQPEASPLPRLATRIARRDR